jgi:NADP-dependent 3-hydroxy acid dehydrogenase YdfG
MAPARGLQPVTTTRPEPICITGIGRATAAALVEAGAAVALLDRDEKAVKETETSLRAAGAEVEAYILDVTDEIALETSFAGVNRRWGRLDILVNNAGISIRHPTRWNYHSLTGTMLSRSI